MNDDRHNELPPALRSGQDLSDLMNGPRRPSRRERLVAWFSRGKLIVIGVVTALVAVVGLANSTLDLWKRTGGAGTEPSDGVDIDFEGPDDTGGSDVPVWDNAYSSCHSPVDMAKVPLDREIEDESRIELDDGATEFGGEDWAIQFPLIFAHPELVDPPESIGGDEWVELESIGATQVGPREVDIYIANRTDDPIMVTDIGIQVEHASTLARTVFVDPAGDPVSPNVLSFNLDEDPPVARECETNESFFDSYKIEIAPRTVEAFEVGIEGGSCWCEVRLDIEYWHQNQWDTETYPAPDRDPIPVVSTDGITGIEQVHYGYQTSSDPTTYNCNGVSFVKCRNSYGF